MYIRSSRIVKIKLYEDFNDRFNSLRLESKIYEGMSIYSPGVYGTPNYDGVYYNTKWDGLNRLRNTIEDIFLDVVECIHQF